jgi:tape measure domain-containing protein
MANNVEIKVDVDVQGAAGVQNLGASLNTTATSATKLGNASTASADGLEQANSASRGFTATTGKLRDGLESVSTQLANAKTELLALVGVGAGVQGVKDISALADSYKNLEARIKLVTGEGKAFDDAFEGVFDVAKRTYTSLEDTGTLFAKIAQAGKELGISQAEALKLTETINQATQLGSQSAEASAAAIQQLIQSLQSGVLRGDEFNSVMEQAPRLQTALSSALGVTGGELRKMAEAGQLSSATVIKALQSQSEVIQGEFNKLPATVGRAMTSLSTEFTRYIGEADKAGGYSEKLAGIIDSLAGNLSTVATVMIKVGQSVVAMKLLSMAQDWLTAGAAIKSTALVTEQHTVSTAKNTIAKAQNTTAVLANTEAQIANAAGTKAAAAAADAGVKSTGMLGNALSMLKPLLVLDIALNYKQYGTAIGEFAAKLMGAKDRTQELADAEKRASAQAEEAAAIRKRQNVALEEARERTFGLTKESSALILKFDDLRGKGDSAADAINSIGKDFDLSNVAGINNAGAVLDTLKEKGKLTADEFRAAWSDALKGVDLGAFEAQARAAFAGTARETERMAQVLDVTAREAIKRTGLDFELISGGMGKASRMAINDTQAIIDGLDRLKSAGVDVGQALTASLVKGIKEAQTEKALAEVRQQVEQVRNALGNKVADGLLDQAEKKARDLKAAIEDITPSVQSAKEAMRMLGVTSDESLNETANRARQAYQAMKESGTSSARELREGFMAYAQAAIAANNGVADGVLIGEAAVRGLRIEADNAGQAIITNMQAGASSVDGLTGSVQGSTQAFSQQATAARRSAEEIIRQTAAMNGQAVASREQIDAANKAVKAQYDKNKTSDTKSPLMGGTPVVAQDNSLPFMIRDKLFKGTLVEDDLKNMETVINVMKTNIASFKSAGPGARSLAGMQDDHEWMSVVKNLEDKAIGLRREKELREAKQALGISSGDDEKKKKDAAALLYSNRFSLSAAEREQLLKKVPKFASGGYHKGGVRLVGENGPELEVTGPSRIINADDTKAILRKRDIATNKPIPNFASGGYHKGGIRLVGEKGPELEITGSSQIAEMKKLATQGGDSFFQSRGYGGGRLQFMLELSKLKAQEELKKKEKEAAEIERKKAMQQKALAIAEEIESRGYRATIASVLNSDAAKREGLDFGTVAEALRGYKSKSFAHEIRVIHDKLAPNGSGKSVSIDDIQNYYKKEKNASLDSSEVAMAMEALNAYKAPAPEPVRSKERPYRIVYDNDKKAHVKDYTPEPAPAPKPTPTPAPVRKIKGYRTDAQGITHTMYEDDAPASNPSISASSAASKTYTVNINIGGKTTSVNTASDADAQRLIEMLKSSKLSSGL